MILLVIFDLQLMLIFGHRKKILKVTIRSGYMIPPKLKTGDHVRVIAPSHSFSQQFTEPGKAQAIKGFERLGLSVSFGKYVYERNDFQTASVEHRLEDLHEAFADPGVQAIVPARGGSSVTQLLKHIDYELVKNNPKILCGLSDITALSYALYAKTGVVNYYGPHFTMLGSSRCIDYSFDSMQEVLMSEDIIRIKPSRYYNNAPGKGN
jgi:muramoyltetrapeptide carboxypeptidase